MSKEGSRATPRSDAELASILASTETIYLPDSQLAALLREASDALATLSETRSINAAQQVGADVPGATGQGSIPHVGPAAAAPIDATIRNHLSRKLRSYADDRAIPKDLQIALGDAADYIGTTMVDEQISERDQQSADKPDESNVLWAVVRLAAEGSDWKRDQGETIVQWAERTLSARSAGTRPVAKTERRLHGDRLTEVISWAETECAAFAKVPHAEKDAKSSYLWLLCQAILDLRDDVLESLRKAG